MFNLELQGPNITSVLFREHEGSYLVGALAAIATVKTGVPGINPQKVIGVIGGTKSPGIDKFIVGYVEGAKSIDPSIRVLVSYANDFGDPAKGKELAKAMFDEGADIIYQVAGGTGQGVIEAAKETGRFAIGVDSDQDYLAPGRVLTSMIKRADTAVYQLVKRLVEGKLEGGVTLNFGLANNGVGISSMRYTRSIFTSTDLARIDQIRRDIISGKIKPTDITTVPDPAAVYRRLGLGR
jgi:basic membrane protein A